MEAMNYACVAGAPGSGGPASCSNCRKVRSGGQGLTMRMMLFLPLPAPFPSLLSPLPAALPGADAHVVPNRETARSTASRSPPKTKSAITISTVTITPLGDLTSISPAPPPTL